MFWAVCCKFESKAGELKLENELYSLLLIYANKFKKMYNGKEASENPGICSFQSSSWNSEMFRYETGWKSAGL